MPQSILSKVVVEYLAKVSKAVKQIAQKGNGKKILRDVISRPDDVEIEIDHVGETILKQLLEKYDINATVFSEPENGDIHRGENQDFYGAIDPFDNSILYLRGFRHTWYTALSFFDRKGNFLVGAIGDILNDGAWIADDNEHFFLNLKTDQKIPLSPSTTKTPGQSFVLASYLMSSLYSVKFLHTFWNLIKAMHPRALLYPFGGAHIYGYLADGRIDAYCMFDEPRSEIDPGFSIAKAAGCTIGSIDENGGWRDYIFIPGKQHEKVPFLVATSTPELRDEIVSYYKLISMKKK